MRTIAQMILPTLVVLLVAATTQPASDDALPELDHIMDSVAEIRTLPFKQPVEAERQSLDDFGAYVEAELDEFFPKEHREGLQQGLMRLGLLLEPIDIGHELKNAFLSQAAAHYDPQAGKFFYLVSDMPAMLLEPVAAHELVHAIQDQHFDLETLMTNLEGSFGKWPRNEDRMLAFRFLIEGEATYVMYIWQMRAMGMDLMADDEMEAIHFRRMANTEISTLAAQSKQMEAGMRQALNLEEGEEHPMLDAALQMDSIPPYILEPLYAAYMKGAYFVMRLRQDGGWETVDGVYENMPLSAEQTLHPEKFLDERDDPTSIELPALGEAIASEWTLVDAAILGEFFLRVVLTNHDHPTSDATKATAGWDGDVYQAYRSGDGQTMMTLATTWDTETDAEEFFTAYSAILPRKYESMTHEGEPGETVSVYDCGEDDASGMLVRRGREVFVVEGGSALTTKVVMDGLMSMQLEYVD